MDGFEFIDWLLEGLIGQIKVKNASDSFGFWKHRPDLENEEYAFIIIMRGDFIQYEKGREGRYAKHGKVCECIHFTEK